MTMQPRQLECSTSSLPHIIAAVSRIFNLILSYITLLYRAHHLYPYTATMATQSRLGSIISQLTPTKTGVAAM